MDNKSDNSPHPSMWIGMIYLIALIAFPCLLLIYKRSRNNESKKNDGDASSRIDTMAVVNDGDDGSNCYRHNSFENDGKASEGVVDRLTLTNPINANHERKRIFQLEIYSAKNLGLHDPYVVVRWDDNEYYRTPSVRNESNPSWKGESMTLSFSPEDDLSQHIMSVEVWHDDEESVRLQNQGQGHGQGEEQGRLFIGGCQITSSELKSWVESAALHPGSCQQKTLTLKQHDAIPSDKRSQKQSQKASGGRSIKTRKLEVEGTVIVGLSDISSVDNYESSPKFNSCYRCKTPFTMFNKILSFGRKKCVKCYKIFCNDCVFTTRKKVENDKKLSHNNEKIVCLGSCKDYFEERMTLEEKDKLVEKFTEYVTTYLQTEKYQCLYPRPEKIASSDFLQATTKWLFANSDDAKDGKSPTTNIFSSVGSHISTQIGDLSDIFNKIAKPVLDKLIKYKIWADPNNPLTLTPLFYYMAYLCMTAGDDESISYAGHDQADEGVIASECPAVLVDYAGEYCFASAWLYKCLLPPPQNDNNWYSWYLAKLSKEKGYTVIMCDNDTTKLQDNQCCPGFALLVKRHSETDPRFTTRGIRGECLLCIRGSDQSNDWKINANDDLQPFTLSGIRDKNSPAISGFVHGGYLLAARSILYYFNMKKYISDFISRGYAIKVVGHSLGAAVASIITLELSNLFAKNEILKMKQSAVETNCNLKWLHGIAFATPPCVTKNLAETIVDEGLILNIVNRFDNVPRISDVNFEKLGKDLTNFNQTYNFHFDRDKSSLLELKSYVQKQSTMTRERLVHATIPFIKVRMQRTRSLPSASEEDDEDDNGDDNVSCRDGEGIRTGGEDLGGKVGKEERVRIIEKKAPSPTVAVFTPGAVIHLYDRDGQVKASLITPLHPTFFDSNVLLLSPVYGPNLPYFHTITTYAAKLRSHRLARVCKGVDVKPTYVPRQAPKDSSNFYRVVPASSSLSSLSSSSSSSSSSILLSSLSSTLKNTTSSTDCDAIYHEKSASDLNLQQIINQDVYSLCGICESPCDWTSDSRSLFVTAGIRNVVGSGAYHRCSICKMVVCTYCSKMEHDKLEIGGKEVDMNLSIQCVPSMGIFEGVRACAQCYFDAYDIL